MFEVRDWDEYKRGVTVTTGIILIATVAAVLSTILTAGQPAVDAAVDPIGFGVVIPAIIIQIPLYETIYNEWGNKKDIAYVAILTILIWFLAWSVILTSGILA